MTTATTETTAANRAGRRVGQVSELTVIAPLKEGGADRLRAVLAAHDGMESGVAQVGTVHDLRWVIFDEDRRLVFATTYDGDWDSYIDDFTTRIPELMNMLFGEVEGWPGITSPTVKDFIAQHQLTATGWFCAYPDRRVTDIERDRRLAAAGDALLDAVSG